MDTEQLITFEQIVRDGSLSRAAWSLGTAQATVSARLQALERAVGGPLFVRSRRGVVLTDLGLSFRPYALRALEVLEAGVTAAQQARTGQRGRVTIGVLESLSGAFFGPALAQFHTTHPEVDVYVRAGRHELLIELLQDGIIQLALLAWPCPDSISTPFEVLLTLRESVLLVAAPAHQLAHSDVVTPAQLMAQANPLLLLRWWVTMPEPLARLMEQARPPLDVPMETGRHMVLSGTGVGFFPWMQVARALADTRLRALAVEGMPALWRSSALVRRAAAAPLAPAAADLVAAVSERAAQLRLSDD